MKVSVNTAALGDIMDLVMGQAPSSKDTNFEGRGTPFVKVGEFGELRPFIREWTTNPLRMARKTDVLLCVVGATCGKINLGEECAIGRSVAAIRPHPSKLDQFYLYYFMMTLVERLRSGSVGAAQTVISKEMVQKVQIPFPPLAEQQRIVGVLDKAFAGLATAQAHAEKNLQNARELFDSHLEAVFAQRGEGWVEKTLGDVCEFLNGFAFKSCDAVSDSQTQLVRMGNLYCNRLNLDRSPVFYPDNFANEYSRYILAAGDIIMSLTGTSGKEDYGFAVRIPECSHTLLMNQRIMKFDAIRQDIIDDGFLLHYLRSRCFLEVLYPTANGTRQANLSSATLKSLPVPLPSMNEQTQIATQLDALAAETQRLQKIYEQKLAALAELKKSLLHQAFSGEL